MCVSVHDNFVYIAVMYQLHIYTHVRTYVGRLLQKTENHYSDFYIQLAAHFLLEIYQETGTVIIGTIFCSI